MRFEFPWSNRTGERTRLVIRCGEFCEKLRLNLVWRFVFVERMWSGGVVMIQPFLDAMSQILGRLVPARIDAFRCCAELTMSSEEVR